MSLTKKDLISFEEDIANEFNNKNIRAPIHLYSGNEDELINIFKDIRPKDWVLCTWRSHYQCLLKGVPPHQLKKEILAGRSIALCFPEYNIFSSAIVTGNIPIAVGIAMAAILKDADEKVFVFIGEMTAETGCFHECLKYSINHNLPIHFIIEDNNRSVCTNTFETWNMEKSSYDSVKSKFVTHYKYTTKYPHAGAGERVQF
jgi:pyruvate dehydrogenase E1 component alpha subunit